MSIYDSPSGAYPPVILRAENLVKKYGSLVAVNGVSFEVHQGEIVGLLGPNGAGKTTSFRMTCGLVPSDSGSVILNGHDVSSWPMHRRIREEHMGYLPQDRSLFGTLTTEKNLYLAMELYGIPKKEQKRNLDETLAKFKLEKVRKSRVGFGGTGGLSGGEARRLEIARAMLAKPKILLLDEPFAGVDPITCKEIQGMIRDLANEGIAILITEHNVGYTINVVDYCYLVNKGQVFIHGTPTFVISNQEAQNQYFGEKTPEELELLKTEIRMNCRGSFRAPDSYSPYEQRESFSNDPAYGEDEEVILPPQHSASIQDKFQRRDRFGRG